MNDNDLSSLREPLFPDVQIPVSQDTDPEEQLVFSTPTNSSNDLTTVVDEENDENEILIDTITIDESEWEHGEDQGQGGCRDCFWAFLFILQFVTVLVLAVMGICNMIKAWSKWSEDDDTDDDDSDADDFKGLITCFWFSLSMLGMAIVLSWSILTLLLGPLAHMLIKISLLASPISFFVTFVVSLVALNQNLPLAFFSLFMSALGICLACRVWHRVPFATANLTIALKAIGGSNRSLWILAYGLTVKSYLWTFLWICAVAEMVYFAPSWVYDCGSGGSDSLINEDANNNDDGDACYVSAQGWGIAIGMLLSYFWTSQVMKNVFHTTIAGVVGAWWFRPGGDSSPRGRRHCCCMGGCCRCCCPSKSIRDSLFRASTSSFGSVCLGSLLEGIMRVLQFLVRCKRREQELEDEEDRNLGTNLLFCLLQCLIDSLERILEYINAWAFVYVGLYGYDYWTAGKTVTTLFKARGWSVIIDDHLVSRSLSMMSILIGFVIGLIGIALGMVFFQNLSYAIYSFFLGSILGWGSCDILFGVVTSAVNTVVVCFAESPNQLRMNHELGVYRDLTDAWRKAYPEECGF